MSGLRTAYHTPGGTPPAFPGAQQRCQKQRYVNTACLSHMLACGLQAPSPTPMSNTSRQTLAPQAPSLNPAAPIHQGKFRKVNSQI